MKIDIKELYKIKDADLGKMYGMFIKAFADYPKLSPAFPDEKTRLAAIEMVLRYYGAYDYAYGCIYSLDDEINEAVAMMHSDYTGFPDDMVEKAGCDSAEFRKAASHLTESEQDTWWGFFEELDREEAALNLPKPFLYLDFVAVDPKCQGEGRGSRIIQTICRYADEQGLPIMLFTNGERDIEFYKKNGFYIKGVTRSEKYGFENTYMWYENR